jgi:hypothetical protein
MSMSVKTIFKMLGTGIVMIMMSSCLSVGERMYNVSRIEKKTKIEDITVSYSTPEKKHLIIGELFMRYNSAYKRETVLRMMVKKAAEYGADGIILKSIRRVEDNWSMSHYKEETPTKFQVETYLLTGSMYQYLE